jgi:ribonuclease D
MSKRVKEYTWTMLETAGQLDRFYRRSKTVEWLAFDTEFIPERYYLSKLCLIPVNTEEGSYIIDVLKVGDISPFIRLVEDSRILKITHAGENDYRILMNTYGAKPRNIFDTQLAYGFLDYEYPLGLQVLVERELKHRISKLELRSDWEKRPLTSRQLDYALGDVVYLYPLMKILEQKLEKSGKREWAREENRRWENPGCFDSDPLDYFSTLPMRNLSRKQKVFLIRLHRWRRGEAEKSDRPLNEVLKTRYLKTIAKIIRGGKSALLKDRTLPNSMVSRRGAVFCQLYEQEVTGEEKALLAQLPVEEHEDPRHRVMMEMLHQLIKMKAAEHSLSPSLVLSKKELNKMKNDNHYFPARLEQGWRKTLLGGELLQWLKNRNLIDVRIDGNTCVLTMR